MRDRGGRKRENKRVGEFWAYLEETLPVVGKFKRVGKMFWAVDEKKTWERSPQKSWMENGAKDKILEQAIRERTMGTGTVWDLIQGRRGVKPQDLLKEPRKTGENDGNQLKKKKPGLRREGLGGGVRNGGNPYSATGKAAERCPPTKRKKQRTEGGSHAGRGDWVVKKRRSSHMKDGGCD